MEWVEAQGKTVEVAVKAALQELGLSSPDEAEIEILQEPKAGFLGLGAQDALVKVTAKPKEKSRRRRKRGRKGKGGEEGGEPRRGEDRGRSERRGRGGGRGGTQGGGGEGRQQTRRDDRKDRGKQKGGAPMEQRDTGSGTDTGGTGPDATITDQAQVAEEFLKGLLEAFGLEGTVTTEVVDEDVLRVEVSGGQTEALVGAKGSVMQSVLELTRTVIQRKTHGAPRMRMDIAGYTERRREALRIYAAKLADRVLDQGGEVMLEPMNPADRKVIHDALAEIDDVISYSEGEDPNRAVVIALAEGVAPRGASSDDGGDADAADGDDASGDDGNGDDGNGDDDAGDDVDDDV
jgi:spoIIIJ-associated protein